MPRWHCCPERELTCFLTLELMVGVVRQLCRLLCGEPGHRLNSYSKDVTFAREINQHLQYSLRTHSPHARFLTLAHAP